MPRAAAVALGALLMVGLPALTGCSMIEGIIEQQTGGDVDLGGNTVPEDFPSAVPLASGEVVNGSKITASGGETVWNVLMNVSDPAAPESIAAQLEGAGFASAGTVFFAYSQHNNQFCISCHTLHDEVYQRFQQSRHHTVAELTCHECHTEPLTAAMAPGGILLQYGALSPEPTPFPLFNVLSKSLTLRGYLVHEITGDPVRPFGCTLDGATTGFVLLPSLISRRGWFFSSESLTTRRF